MNIMLWIGLTLLGLVQAGGLNTKMFQMSMPDVRPFRPELYLCTPVKVETTRNYYMLAFSPNASQTTVHHMLLYGCGASGSKKPVWNCGEMSSGEETIEESGSPCLGGSHSQIIYAWARDAPRLELPDGVGFKVGKDSPIKYLVLQVHYMKSFEEGKTDNSGVNIEYTLTPLRKLAGVLLLGTSGIIPAGPHKWEFMETACEINERKIIHPFAFRVHTHSIGKIVSGYRVRADENGVDQWSLLGKRDPLTPQMFYNVVNNGTIKFGDRVAARCEMYSNRNRATKIGATNEDEMCNFYLMYWVQDDEPLEMKFCFTAGPPYYYWKNPEAHFNHIPEAEANNL